MNLNDFLTWYWYKLNNFSFGLLIRSIRTMRVWLWLVCHFHPSCLWFWFFSHSAYTVDTVLVVVRFSLFSPYKHVYASHRFVTRSSGVLWYMRLLFGVGWIDRKKIESLLSFFFIIFTYANRQKFHNTTDLILYARFISLSSNCIFSLMGSIGLFFFLKKNYWEFDSMRLWMCSGYVCAVRVLTTERNDFTHIVGVYTAVRWQISVGVTLFAVADTSIVLRIWALLTYSLQPRIGSCS